MGNFIMIRRRRRAPVAITFTDNVVDTGNLTTYTFTTRNIGTAAVDRVVVVYASGRSGTDGRTITGVTIGGVAAANLVSNNASNSGGSADGFFALLVPAGTTVTIAVTFSGAMARAAIGVWTVTGNGGVTTTADTAETSSTSAGSSTVNIDVPANGGVIAAGHNACAAGSATNAFSGGVTADDFTQSVEGASERQNGGHAHFSAPQTGLAVTETWGGTVATRALLAVSFGPP